MNDQMIHHPNGAAHQPSAIEVFVGQVLPAERAEDLMRALPAHVKPERFRRNLSIAIAQHPKLLQCDPLAVFSEVAKAAALGLLLDPQLGEAYLITGWDARAGRLAPQLRSGYRGLIKLARQSGQITNIYAHDVCEQDVFRASLGTAKSLIHEPNYLGDRGAAKAFYAVVQFADGADFEVMTIPEIHRIRDRADAWQAFVAKKIKSTPWATDEGEMSKKTVLRRLLKRVPMSPELADAVRLDDPDFVGEGEPTVTVSEPQRLPTAALPPAPGSTGDVPQTIPTTTTCAPVAAQTTTAPTLPTSQQAPQTQTVRGAVTETAYITGQKPYYRIQIESNRIAHDYFTGHEDVYQLAAKVEGTDHLVDAEWRQGRVEKKPARALVSLTLVADDLPPAEGDGGLFEDGQS